MSLTQDILLVLNIVLDYLIYKYVRLEYEESKNGNQLLKKLLRSRKHSTAKKVLNEILKPEGEASGQ